MQEPVPPNVKEKPPAETITALPNIQAKASAFPIPPNLRFRGLAYRLLIVVLAILMVAFFAIKWNWLVAYSRYETTDDAYIQADLVSVISKVPGYIKSMPVVDFQSVKQGDVLAEIEDDDYLARVAQAQADVEAAKAALAVLHSQIQVQETFIDQARAMIDATRADLTRDSLEYQRQATLLKEGLAGNAQRVEQAGAAERHSAATLVLNQSQLRQQESQLEVLRANERQLQADLQGKLAALALAQILLAETHIIAVRDGTVSRRLINPGAYVSTGTQLMTLVPLSDIYVIANFKETQLTNMVAGQLASIAVDAFPGVRLEGRIESFSPASGSQFSLLPPDNATGNFTKVVQRVPVKIRLQTGAELVGRLLPGLSVVVTVDTKSIQSTDSMPR